ncbi:MAG: hypothetical protein ACFFB5_08820 [Promethearchaeota archaeon]
MNISLKEYRIKIISIILIFLIGYSSVAIINADSQSRLLQISNQEFTKESEEIMHHMQESIKNDLNQQIFPSEVSMPLSPEEFSGIARTLEKNLYDSWIASPEYSSFSQETIEGWEVTKEQTPDKATLVLKTNYHDGDYIEKTVFSQRPVITVLHFNDSLFENISVPVLPKTEIPEDFVPEYTTTTYRVDFGIDLPGVNIDKSVKYTHKIFGINQWKVKAWFKFNFKVTLTFPIDLVITHPKRIFEGHEYEFSCKVNPVNIEDFNEYELTCQADYGYSRHRWKHYSSCTKKCWIFCCPGKRKSWWDWSCTDYYRKTPGFSKTKSFTTPLGGDKISFELPKVTLAKLGGIFGDLITFSVSLGKTELTGESVTGLMIISPELWNSRLISWNAAGQTESTSFTVLSHLITPSIDFAITGLTYWLSKITFKPYIELKFGGLLFFLGTITWYLGEIPIECPFPIYTTNWFSSSISVTEDYSAIYDFDMSITKVQDLAPSPFGPYQKFEIDLTNSNLKPDQSDTIELEVLGLPKGFRYEFDLDPALYKLSGETQVDPSEFTVEYGGEPGGISSLFTPNPNPFGVAGQTKATLIIYGPELTDAPPGDWSFTINATSLQSVQYELPDPFITQTAVLTVPETYGVDLEFAPQLYDGMRVNQGDHVAIGFSGQNLGNVNDIINVTARLNTGIANHTWSEEFIVNPYGSEPDNHFLGAFSFVFDRSDVFPDPGLYEFELSANSSHTPYFDKQKTLILNFSEAYGVEASITPETTTVFANWETNFTFSFNNTGNVNDSFIIDTVGWDDYLTYPQIIENVSPMEQQDVIITLRISDPDIVTPDTYNFGIIVTSVKSGANLVFSACEVSIAILEPDRVAPGIYFHEPKYLLDQYIYPELNYRRDQYIYPESPITHNFAWRAVDEYPNSYTVYINGLEFDTGSWTNETVVNVPVTGTNPLVVGVYNITIAFTDISNNVAEDQILLEIVPQDTANPIITYLLGKEVFPLNFQNNIEIYWECFEDYLYTMTLYRNGTPLTLTYLDNFCLKYNLDDPRNWTMKHIIAPGTLTEGTWNFTMVLQDMSNNIATSTVIITITPTDNSDPNIQVSPSSSLLLGYGNTLSATVDDTNPAYFELKLDNTTLLSTGEWLSNDPVFIDIDTLTHTISVGPNELYFNFYDLAGNLLSHHWTFTLVDADKPVLLVAPEPQITIFEHNYTKLELPYWSIADLDPRPGTYEILRNGISIATGTWVKGNATFSLPFAGLTPGDYTYDAYFRDVTGNTLYSSIEVTMLDIIKPLIMSVGRTQYEPLYSPNWFEFYVSELHPSQYKLYSNGTLIEDLPLLSGNPYVFVSLLGLSTGVYEYNLVVEDESGNVGELSVIVKVTDFTPPLIIQPDDLIISEGTTGHFLRWFILEANPNNYSIYLDGSIHSSGTLTATNLSVSLDSLTLGVHTFVLIVYDQFELSHTCTSQVSIVDITAPTLTHISDCRFVVGDLHAKVTWSAYDLHPASYEFKRNNEPLGKFDWDGSDIVLQLVGWVAGNHTLYLEVKDTSGNIVTDEVLIELVLEEKIQSLAPVQTPGFNLILVGLAVFAIINLRKVKRKKQRK